MSNAHIIHGYCIEVMRGMEPNSIDSIVTDPPYGLGFMGKAWDALPPGKEWAEECLRVIKPGGHLLAFGGTRTWHRLAVAVEEAGFEMRDSIAWLYGSGFPKSRDISKDMDRIAGTPRTRIPLVGGALNSGTANGWNGSSPHSIAAPLAGTKGDDTPNSPEAQQWKGWGTALKPAFEPVFMARKPLVGTVAANVLENSTGALNINASRVGERFPSNVIFDESQAATLAEARYFYCAKAPKSERPVVDGVTHPTVKPLSLMRYLVKLVTPTGGVVLDPFAGSGTTLEAAKLEGFQAVGIEAEEAYLPLIEQRLGRAA